METSNLTKAEICPLNLGSNERQLRNGDLIMTYYIIFAGFCTAVVVFFTEVINLYELKEFKFHIYLMKINQNLYFYIN